MLAQHVSYNIKSGEIVKFKMTSNFDDIIIIDNQWHYLKKNDDKLRIVSVCRLDNKQKRIDRAIDVCKLLIEKGYIEKFEWDIKYVDSISIVGDWKIIFATIKTVLKRDGINSETSATMEEFQGSRSE